MGKGEKNVFVEKVIIPVWFFSRIEKKFDQNKKIYYCFACGFCCEDSVFINEYIAHDRDCIKPEKLADVVLARNDFINFCKKHEN